MFIECGGDCGYDYNDTLVLAVSLVVAVVTACATDSTLIGAQAVCRSDAENAGLPIGLFAAAAAAAAAASCCSLGVGGGTYHPRKM